MKPKNLEEFKALKKRYETITLEEIKEVISKPDRQNAANELTGFGCYDTCTLCVKDGRIVNCKECVYRTTTGDNCNDGINAKTYNRILFADNPLKLLNAYRARAKHMQTILNKKS